MVAKRQKNAIEKNAAELAALGERMKAAKTPVKRKPRAKKPVELKPVELKPVVETTSVIPWKTYAKNIAFGFAMLAAGVAGGWWSAGGIQITPVHDDVLQQAYDRDRVTQVAVLRELAEQPFDGATDDGRKKAGEWFNANRFKNRAVDYVPFTDAVAESIAANRESVLAKNLEAK